MRYSNQESQARNARKSVNHSPIVAHAWVEGAVIDEVRVREGQRQVRHTCTRTNTQTRKHGEQRFDSNNVGLVLRGHYRR